MTDRAIQITTADGQVVSLGGRVFSHYTMRAGTIDPEGLDSAGWFNLLYAEGDRDYLDGSRVCSLAHARKMGWLK